MKYIALYRAYRPITFEEVVGQEHVVRALKNTIKSNRIGHAYLFCGTRGTGKTSLAKLFSRAINCLDNKTQSPCNECEICKGILSSSILDVVEIDAASNNSVDNIRELRDEVVYTPSRAKYKVYIIDEVHMLSTGAFNALLKTLEEPPEHVVFILATTEPQKLPATILSRCQRFDFKRISIEDIKNRIKYICDQSNIEIEDRALLLIAKIADGALRDAISILDQCISLVNGKLTYEKLIDVIGLSDYETRKKLLNRILEHDVDGVIEVIDTIDQGGIDFKYFLTEFIEYLRNLLVCLLAKDPSSLIIADDNTINEMINLSKGLSKAAILDLIEDVSKLSRDIKWVTKPKVLVEVGMMKLAKKKSLDIDDVYARLERVEELIKNRGRLVEEEPNYVVNDRKESKPNIETTKKDEDEEEIKNNSKGSSNIGDADEVWLKFLTELNKLGKKMLQVYLQEAKLIEDSNKYTIVFPDSAMMMKRTIEKKENIEEIKKILSQITRKNDILISCVVQSFMDNKNESDKDEVEDNIKNIFKDIPINIID